MQNLFKTRDVDFFRWQAALWWVGQGLTPSCGLDFNRCSDRTPNCLKIRDQFEANGDKSEPITNRTIQTKYGLNPTTDRIWFWFGLFSSNPDPRNIDYRNHRSQEHFLQYLLYTFHSTLLTSFFKNHFDSWKTWGDWFLQQNCPCLEIACFGREVTVKLIQISWQFLLVWNT